MVNVIENQTVEEELAHAILLAVAKGTFVDLDTHPERPAYLGADRGTRAAFFNQHQWSGKGTVHVEALFVAPEGGEFVGRVSVMGCYLDTENGMAEWKPWQVDLHMGNVEVVI